MYYVATTHFTSYLADRRWHCSSLACGEEESTLLSLASFVFTFHCTMKPPHISQVTWLKGFSGFACGEEGSAQLSLTSFFPYTPLLY